MQISSSLRTIWLPFVVLRGFFALTSRDRRPRRIMTRVAFSPQFPDNGGAMACTSPPFLPLRLWERIPLPPVDLDSLREGTIGCACPGRCGIRSHLRSRFRCPALGEARGSLPNLRPLSLDRGAGTARIQPGGRRGCAYRDTRNNARMEPRPSRQPDHVAVPHSRKVAGRGQ